jgi:hypothetical protein
MVVMFLLATTYPHSALSRTLEDQPTRSSQKSSVIDGVRSQYAEIIRDRKTGVVFDAPPGLSAQSKHYGTNWSTSDGDVQIDTLRYVSGSCLLSTYESVRRDKSNKIAVDKLSTAEWLLAGKEETEAWWVKMVYSKGECRGISIVISNERLSDGAVDLMRHISESFDPFPNR